MTYKTLAAAEPTKRKFLLEVLIELKPMIPRLNQYTSEWCLLDLIEETNWWKPLNLNKFKCAIKNSRFTEDFYVKKCLFFVIC